MTAPLNATLAALERVTGFRPVPSGDDYKARCPVHEADGASHTPSLSVRQGDQHAVLMNCHAGCRYEDIIIRLGLEGTPARAVRRIVATYPYRNAAGETVFEKVRYEPKDFRIRHCPALGADWKWKRPDLPEYPLYRLPELLAAQAEGKTIFVVEGEKDADRAATGGLVATCNWEGASEPGKKPKWRKEYTAQLAGAARVVLIPDHDAPGRAHMRHIARQLTGKVQDLRWLELPDLPDKGDLSDYLEQHSVKELLALVESAPPPDRAEDPPADPSADPDPAPDPDPVPDLAQDPATLQNSGRQESGPKKTLATVVAMLSAPPWRGVIGFNAFRQTIEKRQPTPYQGQPGAWRDCDTAETMLHLDATAGVAFSRDMVDLAVMTVAHRHTFNPAQERLRELADRWDGEARLEGWLTAYLSAKTNDSNADYLREIGSAWLKGVCARVLMPGCKRDDVLVLRGPQGWRKSTAAQAIADSIHPDSFTDSVDLNNPAEAKIQIRGVIIAELSELAGMGKAEVEAVKAFVACKQDRFREKFGRHAEDFPRTVSFIGSTNDPNFLKDPTGNRRWWPVTLDSPIDIPRLEAVLPQLVGEAARRVIDGEPWHVTAENALAQAERVREAHYDEDVWTDPVLRIVENMNAAGTLVTTAEILDGLQIPRVQQTPGTQRRVASILKTSGYEEARRWLDKNRTVKQRYWKSSYARDVGTYGYVGTSSQEADKPCTHMGTGYKIDVGTKLENPLTVPTSNFGSPVKSSDSKVLYAQC
ncbi:MAG TPA: VapE family protein, partial [Candidatus Contendobacter sp.]|nr:VapE family protein [Candidatus Contendobacter sp.]HRD48711.1 VapE family protein [Candidatus Contendobacter sp.]